LFIVAGHPKITPNLGPALLQAGRAIEISPKITSWLTGRRFGRKESLIRHERHPQHIGGAGGAQRHAGGDDNAFAGLGKALLTGDL
jgi:hypothetical protein